MQCGLQHAYIQLMDHGEQRYLRWRLTGSPCFIFAFENLQLGGSDASNFSNNLSEGRWLMIIGRKCNVAGNDLPPNLFKYIGRNVL
jgi:hypothetical protein